MEKKIHSMFCAILLVLMATAVCIGFAGCKVGNRQTVDTVYTFNYAYITCGNETVGGEVKSWMDYEDSDMVQVTFTDGTVYYTHGSNIVLIKGE